MTKESKPYQGGFIGIVIAIIGAIIAASAVTTVVLVKNENLLTRDVPIQKKKDFSITNKTEPELNQLQAESERISNELEKLKETVENNTPEKSTTKLVSSLENKNEKTSGESEQSNPFVIPPKPLNCTDCKWNMEKWLWSRSNEDASYITVPSGNAYTSTQSSLTSLINQANILNQQKLQAEQQHFQGESQYISSYCSKKENELTSNYASRGLISSGMYYASLENLKSTCPTEARSVYRASLNGQIYPFIVKLKELENKFQEYNSQLYSDCTKIPSSNCSVYFDAAFPINY
jgi:hypothetical protein